MKYTKEAERYSAETQNALFFVFFVFFVVQSLDSRVASSRVQFVAPPQRREPPHPQSDDDERADAADQHRWHGAEPGRGDPGFELAELVRRIDEYCIDGADSAAHRIGCFELDQRRAD